MTDNEAFDLIVFLEYRPGEQDTAFRAAVDGYAEDAGGTDKYLSGEARQRAIELFAEGML